MITQSQPQIKYLSYSAIKMFLKNRMNFRKKYVLGEKVKEENDAIRLGNLVDFNLTLPEEDFDKHFVLTSAEKPSGQMLDFVEALKKRTIEAIDRDNKMTKDLGELIELAFNDVKYNSAGEEVKFKKKDVDYVKNEFIGKGVGSDYYWEFRKAMDKTVVTPDEIEKARIITNQLLFDPNTAHIFRPEPEDGVEWHDQFPFEVEIDGFKFKGKIDRLKINNKTKFIKPWDGKTTYQVETFEWAYLDDFYYIQNGLYHHGLSEMFPDYYVGPVDFIVADSNAFLRPLMWTTSQNHARQGMDGFDYRGRRWRGIKESIKEIKWHLETNDWRISFDNYRNNGRISIKEFAL